MMKTWWPILLVQLYKIVDTHIDLHPLDREDPDRGRLVRHEPVELVPPLVPLDAVQVVAVQVVGADEVSAVSSLDIPGDPQVNLGQAVKL